MLEEEIFSYLSEVEGKAWSKLLTPLLCDILEKIGSNKKTMKSEFKKHRFLEEALKQNCTK